MKTVMVRAKRDLVLVNVAMPKRCGEIFTMGRAEYSASRVNGDVELVEVPAAESDDDDQVQSEDSTD